MHDAVGVIDVSTLGKILVEGPDAAAFLDRLYPNRFGDLAAGTHPLRRAHDRRRAGSWTTARSRRLGDELFYVTTTSTGSDGVFEWFEWWNAVWGYDVEIVNVTGALAAVNVAGPRAREALARAHRRRRLERGARRTSTRARSHVAGVPCLALRIGFVGELGYELHFPARRRAPLGRARSPRGPPRAVRARAAAHPPAREAARDRRPGHRLGVEPPLRRACRGSSSSTRTTSSASGRSSTCRSAACASGSSASRCRTARCRPRARRSCATAAGGPRHERALERAPRQA